MNYRFKFRFWREHYDGKFTLKCADLMSIDGSAEPYDVDEGDVCRYYPGETIIEQCTGLKDKNGKLIYENDIVKFYFDNDEIIAVLIWDNDESRFYLNTTDYFKDKYVTDYEITKQEKYEVIGNIYENKELLNEI